MVASHTKFLRAFAGIAAAAVLCSCEADSEHGADHEHESEIISRIEITLTPEDGGQPVVFAFNDPDGDGGVSGVADTVRVRAGARYTLGLRFLNGLVQPAEDMTAEIQAEAEDHFVFIGGDVASPAAESSAPLLGVAYADLESQYTGIVVGDDLAVGLAHQVEAKQAGTGSLRIVLRHLPELNGVAQKSADLPARFARNEALPGNVDVDVTFALVVDP
jgi:hypothetical protein